MYWIEGAICLIALVLSVFLGDQVFGLIGYPSAREIQVAHPANFHERQESIEFDIDFQTNSQGLRYEEIPFEKPEGERRVLVLGDSFTEGYGVEARETFSAHLERRFGAKNRKKVRFINGGLTGKGPLGYWRLYYRLGLKYDPDVILICLYANDLSDTEKILTLEDLHRTHTHDYDSRKPGIRKFFHGLFPRVYTALSQLNDQFFGRRAFIEKQRRSPGDFVQEEIEIAKREGVADVKIDAWVNSLDETLVKAADARRLNSPILDYPLMHPKYIEDAIDLNTMESQQKFQAMSFVLDELVKVAATEDTPVWLVYIPSMWQYDPAVYQSDHPWLKGGMIKTSWLEGESEIQRRLNDWATLREIPYLDLTAPLRKEARNGVPLNFPIDGHWNPAGHGVAAKIMMNWMVEQELVNSLEN